MKFFGWTQKKINVDHNRPSTSSASSHSREEFNDWPQALLAIGTFGTTSNSTMTKQESKNVHEEIEEEKKCTTQSKQEEEPPSSSSSSSSDDLEDFTPEEVGKLQKELMKLLSRTKKRKSDVNRELMKNLPLDRFLNCPSSLEIERRISNALSSVVDWSEENKGEDMERTISVILGRCKEMTIDSKKNKKKRDISKTSASYLFKKMFVCADGFSSITPNPRLGDTLQESRVEKLLKMMLHKKINAQASSKTTPSTTKRCLQDKKQFSLKSEGKPTPSTTKRCLEEKKQLSLKCEKEEENTSERSSNGDGYKWVKTDSDCES